MPVVTLQDVESQHPTLANGNLLIPGGNTVWSINIGLWVILMVVANLMHPPASVLLALNAVLLLLNLNAVQKAGSAPTWLYVVIAVQCLVTLQVASIVLQSIF